MNPCATSSLMSLTDLPFDVLFLIGSKLDLRSLVCLSSTCRYLREHCLHPLQFQSVNLQPYWTSLTNASIEDFFQHRCIQTRYLSLSWSKSIDISPFDTLMNVCADQLIQLNLACCQYLTGEHIQSLVNACPNLQILNFESCDSLNNLDFVPLAQLNHIRSLNVYRTKIDYRTLLPLIDKNAQHFEHINLGQRLSICQGRK
jgi:F-box and leucine-rich repeat protein 4